MAALWAPPAPGTRWLLRLPNWVGDAVMVLPAIRALPSLDQFRIGIAHPRVVDIYTATGLFQQVLPANGSAAPLALRSQLRTLHPDRCLVFTEAPSGGWLAVFSGVPLRMGRAQGFNRLFFTHTLPPATRHQAAWREHMEVAEAAGALASVTPDFRVPLTDALRSRTQAHLPSGDAPLIALAPGAAYGPAKRWPLERFAELAKELEQIGYRVIVTGSKQEAPLGRAIAATGATDLTGQTTLLETIAVLERANLLVSNDSGALHLARAAGTPVVALFGSSSPTWTGPESKEGDVLRHVVPCSPCFKRHCPLQGDDHLRCLRGISVENVMDAITRRLGAAR
jgi:lipopolysaccharide heptosyltransferase II